MKPQTESSVIFLSLQKNTDPKASNKERFPRNINVPTIARIFDKEKGTRFSAFCKEEEIKKFAQEMKDILSNFEKLNEVDTKDVPPSFHPVPIKNTSRPDEKGECLTTQEALSLSPHTSGNYFKGPKIL